MDKINLDLNSKSSVNGINDNVDTGSNTAEFDAVSFDMATNKKIVSAMTTNDEDVVITDALTDFVDETKTSASSKQSASINKNEKTNAAQTKNSDKTAASSATPTTNKTEQKASANTKSNIVGDTSSTLTGSVTVSEIKKKQNENNNAIIKLNNNISYLEQTLKTVQSQLETAQKNGDENKIYVLEQQIASCNSQIELFKIQLTQKENLKSLYDNYLSVAQKYSNNSAISTDIMKILNLEEQMSALGLQKCAAMQREDEQAQYTLEQQENTIAGKIKELKIDLAKAEAKADGRKINNTELELISYQADVEFRQYRIEEKQMYLKYKAKDIYSQKLTAMKNGDDEALFILEQQENSINALYNIFETDKNNIDKQNKNLPKYLELLQKYPDNSSIENIVKQTMELEYQLSGIASQKSTAMQNEDEQAQYTLEQQENTIAGKIKQLKIDLAKAEAKADGRKISDSEIQLLEYQADVEFREDRIQEKRMYLAQKISNIASQKLTAMKNNDKELLYILEQQENSINALDKIFEMDSLNIEKQNANLPKYLELLQKYPDNSNIANIIKQSQELEYQLLGIASQKSTAMQNEDEQAQYTLEQQENKIFDKIKQLRIDLAKAEAKAEGRSINNTEIKLLEYQADIEIKLHRIQEKRQYLSYKAISISSQKSTALQNEDTYSQYVLEQQTNSINALDTIFETDQNNLEKINNMLSEYLSSVQKYPKNSAIANAVTQLITLQDKLLSVTSQKLTAIQNDDSTMLKTIQSQEDTIYNQMIELEISIQQEVAKEQGKPISDTEISKIKQEKQTERNKNKTNDYRQYIGYLLINIAQQKSTAMQNQDEYAQYILEQQENYLNELLEKSEITSLDDFFKLEKNLVAEYQNKKKK